MGFFDFLFGKKKPTLEDANKINQEFIAKNPTPINDENGFMRQASGFLTSGQFPKAIVAYTELAQNYPTNKGLYLSQVGVAHHYSGEYQKAIDFYIQALEAGEDANMMDDNTWEACEELYKETKDKTCINTYLQHFPEGSYVKQARKLL